MVMFRLKRKETEQTAEAGRHEINRKWYAERKRRKNR